MRKAISRQTSVVRLILVCFVFVLLLQPITYKLQPVLAVDSSPSADNIEKLRLLREEIASRSADMIKDVRKKLLNKAYVGVIKSKDSTSLSVGLKNGTGNINVNEFTEYIIKSKTLVGNTGLKNIAVSDSIAALGDIDENGVLTAKRIVKLTKPNIPKKVIHGILTSVATSSATLKTVQNDQFLITFDKNTDYQIGKSDSSFSEIKANKWIIAVTEEVNPQTLLTKFVYIFPNALIVKPKTSTPSAKITP